MIRHIEKKKIDPFKCQEIALLINELVISQKEDYQMTAFIF